MPDELTFVQQDQNTMTLFQSVWTSILKLSQNRDTQVVGQSMREEFSRQWNFAKTLAEQQEIANRYTTILMLVGENQDELPA